MRPCFIIMVQKVPKLFASTLAVRRSLTLYQPFLISAFQPFENQTFHRFYYQHYHSNRRGPSKTSLASKLKRRSNNPYFNQGLFYVPRSKTLTAAIQLVQS